MVFRVKKTIVIFGLLMNLICQQAHASIYPWFSGVAQVVSRQLTVTDSKLYVVSALAITGCGYLWYKNKLESEFSKQASEKFEELRKKMDNNLAIANEFYTRQHAALVTQVQLYETKVRSLIEENTNLKYN